MHKYDRRQLTPYQMARMGSQLIPLHKWDTKIKGVERGKSPRDNRWRTTHYSAKDIDTTIKGGYNIGFRLSKRDLVIDYDPRNDVDGAGELRESGTALGELEFAYGIDLAEAPCVVTGSGGNHFYFRIPEGTRIRNSLPYIGPSVEFKAYGRQVVAPGSKHPNGELYRWGDDTPDLKGRPELDEDLLLAIQYAGTDDGAEHAAGEWSGEMLGRMLEQLEVEEYNDHDKWLQIMMSAHHATAGSGVDEFVAWSTDDPRYVDQAESIRERWASLRPGGGISAATIQKAVKDSGGEPARVAAEDDFDVIEVPEGAEVSNAPVFERTGEGRVKSTFKNAHEAIRALGLEPAYDVMHDRYYLRGDLKPLRPFYGGNAEVYYDLITHAIRSLVLFTYRAEFTVNMIDDAVTAHAIGNEFHPLRDYLKSLKWDGVERIKSWLVSYCGAEPGRYSTAVGRTVLIAAVARAFRPGIKFDTMMVLEGPQGCGKSTLVNILAGEFVSEGLPNRSLNDRDVVSSIHDKWLVEIEELAATRKQDVETLKAFLSRTVDRARLAYERKTRDFPRGCIFIGTTNQTEYLEDTTGNRRFMPMPVGTIDLRNLKADRDQLWAEAVAAWEGNPAPAALVMPENLWDEMSDHQEERRKADPIEEALEIYLGEQVSAETEFVATSDILWDVFQCTASSSDARSHAIRLSRIMVKFPDWKRYRRMEKGIRHKGYRFRGEIL